MRHPTYETSKEAVGQADAENRSDLFRMHLLRRGRLIERNYLTPKTRVDSHPYSRQCSRRRPATMELCVRELYGCAYREDCATDAIEHCHKRRL